MYARRFSPFVYLSRCMIALVLSFGVVYALHLLNPLVSQIVLFLLLSFLFFGGLPLLRARTIISRMRHGSRMSHYRGNDWPDRGDGGSGVREPRRPYPPFFPPRAAVLEPETESS